MSDLTQVQSRPLTTQDNVTELFAKLVKCPNDQETWRKLFGDRIDSSVCTIVIRRTASQDRTKDEILAFAR